MRPEVVPRHTSSQHPLACEPGAHMCIKSSPRFKKRKAISLWRKHSISVSFKFPRVAAEIKGSFIKLVKIKLRSSNFFFLQLTKSLPVLRNLLTYCITILSDFHLNFYRSAQTSISAAAPGGGGLPTHFPWAFWVVLISGVLSQLATPKQKQYIIPLMSTPHFTLVNAACTSVITNGFQHSKY